MAEEAGAPPSVTVYGAPWCPDCRRSKTFLSEQRVPYRWVDIDADADGLRYVEALQNGGRTIPTIVFEGGDHLLEPTNEELARRLGLTLEAKRGAYDLAIIGGGPAGLAAAIYAAREGIEAIVVEQSALGGQAGVTDRIDNYPGFPDGVGGSELAERFIAQARRYEVELLSAVGVEGIGRECDDLVLTLGGGREICAHAVIIATGSSYRRLGVPGEEELIGAGIHFCATCDGPFYRGSDELLVIGGGNSALEEGLHLARFAKRVRVIQRGGNLTASVLLQDKVRSHPQFTVETGTTVVSITGNRRVETVTTRNLATGELASLHPAAVFVFIGLDPNTAFLRGSVELDERGFVIDAGGFSTSVPGVFVAGDVRRGSTKQLGSAVGDGIAALIATRQYLQDHHQVVVRSES